MIERSSYSIVSEPRGVVYRELCAFAERQKLDVLLVVRDRPSLSASGAAILAQLAPYLFARNRVSEWPGTRLIEETATSHVFRLDEAGWALVQEAVQGLFEWQQPAFPEDLCFLRHDGSVFLGSIAHERDAFLEVVQEEADALAAAVPNLEVETTGTDRPGT